jgi:DNA-binding XRE family transcriptional regulator
VYESPTEFPAVTICNLNPFDLTSDNRTGYYVANILEGNEIMPNISIDEGDYALNKVKMVSDTLKATVIANSSLTDEELKALGFSLDDFLISCTFNGRRCNESDFEWSRTFEYGNCYTFNGASSRPKYTSKSGPANGLVLELYIGLPYEQDIFTYISGAYVIVHNRTNRVPLTRYEGMPVQAGAATNIGVSRTTYVKKEDPYSDCRMNVSVALPTDSDYFRYTINMTKYTQKFCYELCLQYEFIFPKCNCTDPSIPLVNKSLLICSNSSLLECVNDVRSRFDSSPISEQCSKYCPLECTNEVFETSISIANYPTRYYATLLERQNNFKARYRATYSFTPFLARKPIDQSTTTIMTSDSSTSTTKTSQIQPIKNLVKRQLQSNERPNSSMNKNSNKDNQFQVNFDKDNIKSTVLMVNVYYNDLRCIYIEEEPTITFNTLVGVIGNYIEKRNRFS